MNTEQLARQTSLFTVPAAPRPKAWGIVWRWNPVMRMACKTPEETADFLEWIGTNPWQIPTIQQFRLREGRDGVSDATDHRLPR